MRYGPSISHDDETVPQGHHRQETIYAFPSTQNEGQTAQQWVSRGSLDGHTRTWHQHGRC